MLFHQIHDLTDASQSFLSLFDKLIEHRLYYFIYPPVTDIVNTSGINIVFKEVFSVCVEFKQSDYR